MTGRAIGRKETFERINGFLERKEREERREIRAKLDEFEAYERNQVEYLKNGAAAVMVAFRGRIVGFFDNPPVSWLTTSYDSGKKCSAPETFQRELRPMLISLNHDRHLSSDFQPERGDCFKLPLVGMATLSPGRIPT
jgi:hypothetical protein